MTVNWIRIGHGRQVKLEHQIKWKTKQKQIYRQNQTILNRRRIQLRAKLLRKKTTKIRKNRQSIQAYTTRLPVRLSWQSFSIDRRVPTRPCYKSNWSLKISLHALHIKQLMVSLEEKYPKWTKTITSFSRISCIPNSNIFTVFATVMAPLAGNAPYLLKIIYCCIFKNVCATKSWRRRNTR